MKYRRCQRSIKFLYRLTRVHLAKKGSACFFRSEETRHSFHSPIFGLVLSLRLGGGSLRSNRNLDLDDVRMLLSVRAQHLLPDSDMITGPGVEETARLTIPAAAERLFAGLVANTDCALDDSRAASLRLSFGSTNKSLAEPSAFMALTH
jgi:hypothetical protein